MATQRNSCCATAASRKGSVAGRLRRLRSSSNPRAVFRERPPDSPRPLQPANAVSAWTLPHWEARCSSSARKRRRARRVASPNPLGAPSIPGRTSRYSSQRAVAQRRRTLETAAPARLRARRRLASLSVGISNGLQSPLLVDEVSVLPHASLAPASSAQGSGAAKVLEAGLRGDPDTGPHVRKCQLDGDRARRERHGR